MDSTSSRELSIIEEDGGTRGGYYGAYARYTAALSEYYSSFRKGEGDVRGVAVAAACPVPPFWFGRGVRSDGSVPSFECVGCGVPSNVRLVGETETAVCYGGEKDGEQVDVVESASVSVARDELSGLAAGGGLGGCDESASGEHTSGTDGLESKKNGVDGLSGAVCGVPGFGIRGPNYERNKKKRDAKKAARDAEYKAKGKSGFSGMAWVERKALNDSYAQRLKAENELKAFKAKQQLELEKAKDLSQLKKRQETLIMRQTETNKVQVEKAFASLARTGNVPGVVGSVETVVTEGGSAVSPVFSGIGSGTISPNSSVSLAEIRAIQKESLERAAENEKLKRRMERLLEFYPDLKGCKFFEPDAPETVNSGVTVDSNGFPIGEFGDGYDGGIREDGKWHFGQDIY